MKILKVTATRQIDSENKVRSLGDLRIFKGRRNEKQLNGTMWCLLKEVQKISVITEDERLGIPNECVNKKSEVVKNKKF